jgi:hypothetical protein
MTERGKNHEPFRKNFEKVSTPKESSGGIVGLCLLPGGKDSSL